MEHRNIQRPKPVLKHLAWSIACMLSHASSLISFRLPSQTITCAMFQSSFTVPLLAQLMNRYSYPSRWLPGAKKSARATAVVQGTPQTAPGGSAKSKKTSLPLAKEKKPGSQWYSLAAHISIFHTLCHLYRISLSFRCFICCADAENGKAGRDNKNHRAVLESNETEGGDQAVASDLLEPPPSSATEVKELDLKKLQNGQQADPQKEGEPKAWVPRGGAQPEMTVVNEKNP